MKIPVGASEVIPVESAPVKPFPAFVVVLEPDDVVVVVVVVDDDDDDGRASSIAQASD